MQVNSMLEDNGLSRRLYGDEEIVQSFISIDIDTNLNESSISKKYKWITSLELISADEFRQKIMLKDRNTRTQEMVKHFPIDKILYLVVNYCEEGKFPITRIRTRKQSQDHQWKIVPYPKQFEGLYQLNICYQYTQSKQCKRIITDIQVCHSKQLQSMGVSQDQWQIATIPEISIKPSKLQRQTQSQTDQNGQSNKQPLTLPIFMQSKNSDRSWARQNNSNLSDNSYYSCNQNQSNSKSSIQKDNFSDLDDKSPSFNSNEKHSKKSSLSEFHSIEQTNGPFYFLMKTIDLYDYHNQFQYTYEPKITKITKINNNSTIMQNYLHSITKFCFPNRIRLFKKISGCGYQTFTLILTTQSGERYYAYCLKYKQKMTPEVEKELLKQLYQMNLIEKNQIYKNQTIYNEKAFCLISKIQNSDVFHKILENIYRALLSFSSPEKGTEYFSKNNAQRKIQFFALDLVQKLRQFSKNVFKKERKNFMEPIKSIPLLGSHHETLEFKWCGINTNFPKRQLQNKISMKALYSLFKLLSIENILKVLEAALLEKKIFIVSCIQVSIFHVLEALMGILHPLRLSQPIIPIIYSDLVDLIEAPVPIVAGIAEQFVNENTMTKAIYVFLDCNKILVLQDLPQFPTAFSKLAKSLRKIQFFDPDHIVELINYRQEVYSLSIHEIQEYNTETHDEIKSLLQNTIVSIIKEYSSFYSKLAAQNMKKQKQMTGRKTQPVKQVQSQRLSKVSTNSQKYRKHMTFKQMYTPLKFIKSHEKRDQAFYQQFCKSSIFKNLIQQKYNDPESDQIKLIDRLIEHVDDENVYYSCLSIPVSSLKKEVYPNKLNDMFEAKKSSNIKQKSKMNERCFDERVSLTEVKGEQPMRKHASTKQQEKVLKKNTVQSRKAINIPVGKEHQKFQRSRKDEEQNYPTQRLSQGAVYHKQGLKNDAYMKQGSNHDDHHEHKSMGFRICSMVNNVTKKFTQSKTNIVNIFNQAKINRLKKVFNQQNKQKNHTAKQCQNLQQLKQQSQNNIMNLTAPQISRKN